MSTKQNPNAIPTWLLGYTGFLVLLGLGAGITAIVAPASIFMNPTMPYGDVVPITLMFAARNIALGTIAVIALLRRDPKYLLLLFIARFVVEIGDLIVALTTDLSTLSPVVILITWLILFIIPQGMGINVLRKLVD